MAVSHNVGLSWKRALINTVEPQTARAWRHSHTVSSDTPIDIEPIICHFYCTSNTAACVRSDKLKQTVALLYWLLYIHTSRCLRRAQAITKDCTYPEVHLWPVALWQTLEVNQNQDSGTSSSLMQSVHTHTHTHTSSPLCPPHLSICLSDKSARSTASALCSTIANKLRNDTVVFL